MKRFTDTETLRDPWVRQLSLDAKLVYWYLKDNCDAAGVWEPDKPLVNFTFQRDIDWPTVQTEMTASFNGDDPRIEILPTGKWYLTRFIAFQYGKLSEECFPHRKVLDLIKKHSLHVDSTLLPRVARRVVKSNRLPGRVAGTPQEEDKDKEEDKEEDKDKSLLQLRVEAWFHRRRQTPWDHKERAAWDRNRLVIEATPEDDLKLLDWWFAQPNGATCRRKAIETLLNNWNTEISRAQAHKAGDSPHANDQRSPNSRAYSQADDYSGVKNK